MTDFKAMLEKLPKGLWRACVKQPRDGWLVEVGIEKAVIASRLTERIARTVAAIPDMLARIKDLEEYCERLGQGGAERYWEGRWRDEKAENDRLRALVAELREVLANVKIADVGNRSFIGVQCGNSCASAEITTDDKRLFGEWKAMRDIILAKSEEPTS